ncbi:MAG: hypothetical protein AB1626_00550 [Candidatus Micrarchaeota archaeon]
MKRGQVSAPVELFVAVIIMAMSMALAFFVMSQTQSAQCEDQLRAEMRSLAGKLLDVSLGSPPTSREVTVHMTKCGNLEVRALRIVHYTKPVYCRNCPTAAGECWQIIPVEYNVKSNAYYPVLNAITCVDMPTAVQLAEGTEADGCVPLSNDPCPATDERQEQYVEAAQEHDKEGFMCGGVYEEGWTPDPTTGELPSGASAAYKTLGQSGSRVWNIKLSKETGTAQRPTVRICAYDPRERRD